MPSDDSDGDTTSSTLKPKNIIKGEPGPGVEDDITSIFFHYWRFLVPLFWCGEGFPENSVPFKLCFPKIDFEEFTFSCLCHLRGQSVSFAGLIHQ